jgi:hypothetical protein
VPAAGTPAPGAGATTATTLRGTAVTIPPPGGATPPAPLTRLDRSERRAQLRALSDEFRARIGEMRTEGGENRQEETRALLEWYREQRRAIMRGGGRTDQ